MFSCLWNFSSVTTAEMCVYPPISSQTICFEVRETCNEVFVGYYNIAIISALFIIKHF